MHSVQRRQLPGSPEHFGSEVRKRHPADYEGTKFDAREQGRNRGVDIDTCVLARIGCVSYYVILSIYFLLIMIQGGSIRRFYPPLN